MYLHKGTDFAVEHPEGNFEQAHMNSLFDYGSELGRTGYPWAKVPPLLRAPSDVLDKSDG